VNKKNNYLYDDGFKLVGRVCVDSGQLMIIDPCYLRDWKHGDYNCDSNVEGTASNNYEEACFKTLSEEKCGDVLGGLGFVFSSGYGDGTYNVYVRYFKNLIGEVRIVLINDDIENEEEEETDFWGDRNKEEEEFDCTNEEEGV